MTDSTEKRYPLVNPDVIKDSTHDFVSSPAIQELFANKSAVHEGLVTPPARQFAAKLGAPIVYEAQGDVTAENRPQNPTPEVTQ